MGTEKVKCDFEKWDVYFVNYIHTHTYSSSKKYKACKCLYLSAATSTHGAGEKLTWDEKLGHVRSKIPQRG